MLNGDMGTADVYNWGHSRETHILSSLPHSPAALSGVPPGTRVLQACLLKEQGTRTQGPLEQTLPTTLSCREAADRHRTGSRLGVAEVKPASF